MPFARSSVGLLYNLSAFFPVGPDPICREQLQAIRNVQKSSRNSGEVCWCSSTWLQHSHRHLASQRVEQTGREERGDFHVSRPLTFFFLGVGVISWFLCALEISHPALLLYKPYYLRKWWNAAGILRGETLINVGTKY